MVPLMSELLEVVSQPTIRSSPAGAPAVDRTTLATIGMLAVCAIAAGLASSVPTSATNDGADAVPLIALLGIAIAIARWHPIASDVPVRGVATSLAVTIGGAALACVAVVIRSTDELASGAAITLALTAGYLLTWGYRSVALLRTVVLLSLLTWPMIGGLAHVIVRSSLQQPSDLVYQRLAQFQAFGVRDEPWRLFTASLHRGSLVVVATLVFAIVASRWRVSARTFVDLALTASAAVVAHHVVVLLSPIDDYDPTGTDQLATDPMIEIAIAAAAVFVLALVRHRRDVRGPHDGPLTSSSPVRFREHRDPVIFSSIGAAPSRMATAMLTLGFAPVVAALLV